MIKKNWANSLTLSKQRKQCKNVDAFVFYIESGPVRFYAERSSDVN